MTIHLVPSVESNHHTYAYSLSLIRGCNNFQSIGPHCTVGCGRQYTAINRHKNMRKFWVTFNQLSKPIFDCEVGHSLTTCCSGSGTRTREANAAAYETAQIPTSDIPLFLNPIQIYELFRLSLSAGKNFIIFEHTIGFEPMLHDYETCVLPLY